MLRGASSDTCLALFYALSIDMETAYAQTDGPMQGSFSHFLRPMRVLELQLSSPRHLSSQGSSIFRILALQSGCGGRCPHGPGAHVALAGKEAGGFKTSRAKVYPPAMNQAIAAAFHVYVHRLQPVQAATTLPTQLKELNVDEIKEISEVQPDFHG